MGIKLEWQTARQQNRVVRGGEDPELVRRRRAALRRLVLFVLLIVAIGAGLVGIAVSRLRNVENILVEGLRTAVETEVTALRLGDRQAFLDAQWTSQDDPTVTAAWAATQVDSFRTYQALKLDAEVALTGRVLDVTLDGQNGRVRVEEIINGIPYGVVWFYWRFDEGWRHVPPAYGFWGEPGGLADPAGRFAIGYRDVDMPVAQAMAADLAPAFDVLCGLFGCEGTPTLRFEIGPFELSAATWSPDDPWVIQVPSPYLTRARLDRPFEGEQRQQVASLVVARWMGGFTMPAGTDSAFLRDAAAAYVQEQFSGTDTGAHLFTSLVETYGVSAGQAVLSELTAETTITALARATGQPLEVLAFTLDWRDYLADSLRREGATDVEVISAVPERTLAGLVSLRAVVASAGIGTTEIFYNLGEDSRWRRVG